MVSHGLSLTGGYACLAAIQTTVGDPRFALAVQGCLLSCVCRTMSWISAGENYFVRVYLHKSLHSVCTQYYKN